MTENGLNYLTLYTGNKYISIHNENHSFVKNISLNVPQGFDLEQLYFVSDKLFNSDSEIEILLGSKSQTSLERKMLLYNENGEVIFDFGNKFKAEVLKVKVITLN